MKEENDNKVKYVKNAKIHSRIFQILTCLIKKMLLENLKKTSHIWASRWNLEYISCWNIGPHIKLIMCFAVQKTQAKNITKWLIHLKKTAWKKQNCRSSWINPEVSCKEHPEETKRLARIILKRSKTSCLFKSRTTSDLIDLHSMSSLIFFFFLGWKEKKHM